MSETQIFTVSGMTCGHCVEAVRSEVAAIEGVSHVEVQLADGAVTITSTTPIDVGLVAAAVDEAGYELVR